MLFKSCLLINLIMRRSSPTVSPGGHHTASTKSTTSTTTPTTESRFSSFNPAGFLTAITTNWLLGRSPSQYNPSLLYSLAPIEKRPRLTTFTQPAHFNMNFFNYYFCNDYHHDYSYHDHDFNITVIFISPPINLIFWTYDN